MASKSDVFQRLVGLETEYALFLPQTTEHAAKGPLARGRLGRYGLFRDLVTALRRRLPAVPARHMKEGVFHAAGGAVWFETERPAEGGGLIEGSTPECRSPRQVIAWQRAQDELLCESVEEASAGAVRLVKNDRDAAGNIYGAQESYDAIFATGWRLWLWRAALVAMSPLAFATWLTLWVIDKAVILYVLAATVLYLLGERLLRRPEWLSQRLFGCDIKDIEGDAPTGPVWLEVTLSWLTRVVTAPLAAIMYLALWPTAFAAVRRQMLPFLVSRPISSGSGLIDDSGAFQLSDKAPGMNCIVGLGGFVGDRPLLSHGHFFKVVNADPGMVWGEYCRLFAARQRLQIGLGDSNMCEPAEYLRVGTTLLVLDCIEAGQMPRVPRLRRPIRALWTICADPTLTARVKLSGGRQATALELQRFYLEACRRFLDRRADAPLEAREILHRWELALDALADDPQSLVGTLDWVTKQFVLDKAGKSASWDVRKKIDIRYHELSPQGYFQRLRTTGIVRELLDRAEVDHARRNPPAGTPAAIRGRYIREFALEADDVTANWRAVYLRNKDGDRRTIRLDSFQPSAPTGSSPGRRKTKKGDASGG